MYNFHAYHRQSNRSLRPPKAVVDEKAQPQSIADPQAAPEQKSPASLRSDPLWKSKRI